MEMNWCQGVRSLLQDSMVWRQEWWTGAHHHPKSLHFLREAASKAQWAAWGSCHVHVFLALDNLFLMAPADGGASSEILASCYHHTWICWESQIWCGINLVVPIPSTIGIWRQKYRGGRLEIYLMNTWKSSYCSLHCCWKLSWAESIWQVLLFRKIKGYIVATECCKLYCNCCSLLLLSSLDWLHKHLKKG